MTMVGNDGKIRCFGGKPGQAFYALYHDQEWGIPCHNDQHLFEMLILEGAQAGLSWETILKKREGYRKAFHHFDPRKVAAMHDVELEDLRQNPAIVRNKLKIYATRQNARVFLKIQQAFGSFDRYLWSFVNGKPIINHWKRFQDVPNCTAESDLLSKDLKKQGMTFVGSTIIYAYMQAVGMVNDHLIDCWCYKLPNTTKNNKELLSLKNVGKATMGDLQLLGITTIKQLQKQNPDSLYTKLQKITGSKQDPCVWDVFAAIIHEAKTGEKLPWWHFSKIRKNHDRNLVK